MAQTINVPMLQLLTAINPYRTNVTQMSFQLSRYCDTHVIALKVILEAQQGSLTAYHRCTPFNHQYNS